MKIKRFIDSNIWLYAYLHDQDRHKRAVIEPLLTDSTSSQWIISTQVVAEVGSNLLRKGQYTERELRVTLETLRNACDVTPVTIDTGLRASKIREVISLSYWDGLIIAAALEAGCSELWSEDMQDGQVIDGRLRIVNPFAERWKK